MAQRIRKDGSIKILKSNDRAGRYWKHRNNKRIFKRNLEMERSYTKATKWGREPNCEGMVSWKREASKQAPAMRYVL